MADVLGGIPLATKMYAFEAEVGCDQRVVPGGNAENSAVVADTGDQSLCAGCFAGSESSNARNQFSFGERHGNDDMRSRLKFQLKCLQTPLWRSSVRLCVLCGEGFLGCSR